MRIFLLPVVALSALAAACGEQGGTTAALPGTPPPADVEVVASTTVLDAGSGPQLCLGGVMQSLPPQCGGPPVVGWDWAEVAHESAGGVRWGDYAVRGTWDGERLTLTAPPTAPAPAPEPPPHERFASPCAEPDGGWRPVDVARTTDATLEQALARADRLEGVGEVWVDQSPNPAYGQPDEAAHERLNDPQLLVVNVTVVGDAADRAGAEQQLREVWGGALCVSEAHRSRRELHRIQHEVQRLLGPDDLLMAAVTRDVLEITVVHDDGSLQAELDEAYGVGAVAVSSALRPARG